MSKTTTGERLVKIESDISYIKQTVDKIENRLGRDYVTREEFDPIKKVVYGLVSITLIGVIGAILGLVVIQ